MHSHTPHALTSTGSEATPPREAHAARQAVDRPLRLVLVIGVLLLYGQELLRARGYFGDSFHHVMNGIFLFDALHDPRAALSDPREFLTRYYGHYPAVSLGYYPPVFPLAEAALMAVFGVSPVSGQLAVLLSVVLLSQFCYSWLRLRFGPWWAGATTVVLLSNPLLVRWGRDVMLELPALALMAGAVWQFERMLREGRAPWGRALSWALLTVLAVWTKQHALLLLGVYGVGLLVERRWRLLACPRFLTGALIVAGAVIGLLGLTFALGGDAVGHSVGFTRQHALDRLNLDQWTFYFWRLPEVAGWPVLVLAGVGALSAALRREAGASLLVAWALVFYVMHSYFRAQEVRYACLLVPPLVVLAVIGVRELPAALLGALHRASPLAPKVAAGLLALLTGYSVVQAARVEPRTVPTAYQRAADDLADRLGRASCLTFLPDNPGRPAVCYRLAVEEYRKRGRDIYSMGRILRANQVLWDWKRRWPSIDALAETLAANNVHYLLVESPAATDPNSGDAQTAAVLDGLLATGQFQAIRDYPLVRPNRRISERTLTLYERIGPKPISPDGGLLIRTGRIPMIVGTRPPATSP